MGELYFIFWDLIEFQHISVSHFFQKCTVASFGTHIWLESHDATKLPYLPFFKISVPKSGSCA